MCSCRPCYLLFTERGAGAGKFASVPERYLFDPDFTLSDAQWDQFQIPVKMAFFFVNSVLDQTVAFYPSPAGATESLLPADTWQTVPGVDDYYREAREKKAKKVENEYLHGGGGWHGGGWHGGPGATSRCGVDSVGQRWRHKCGDQSEPRHGDNRTAGPGHLFDRRSMARRTHRAGKC